VWLKVTVVLDKVTVWTCGNCWNCC